MRVVVVVGGQEHAVAGTVFSDGRPRLIQIQGINLEAELGPHMLYTENSDKPGYIGALGTVLGQTGVNIATFTLGREERGGKATALIGVDDRITHDVLAKVRDLPHVMRAERLAF